MHHASTHHVASLNIGQLWHPLDDSRTAGFTDNADRVNAIAERSDGFVWRLVDEEAALKAEGIALYGGDPNALCTLSVWQRPEDLMAFVSKTVHGAFVKRRGEWFKPQDHRTYVLWPVPQGHRPSIQEGLDKLAALEANGPNEGAYDFNYLRQQSHRRDET